MSILMVTGIEGARNCADVVSAQLGIDVEVASGRKVALAVLRQREFLAVVVDETLAECDPAAAEKICELAGLAIPLQINFAVSGAARLIREIRAALHRREREEAVARKAAAAAIEADHGHANVMFVMGGPVQGGKVYGKWPGLDDHQLNEGRDLALTTDFRSVIGEILTRHIGVRRSVHSLGLRRSTASSPEPLLRVA